MMLNSTPFSEAGASADALSRTQMPIEVKKFNHQSCKYLWNSYNLLTSVTIFFIACTGYYVYSEINYFNDFCDKFFFIACTCILRNWIKIEIDSKLGETNCLNNWY